MGRDEKIVIRVVAGMSVLWPGISIALGSDGYHPMIAGFFLALAFLLFAITLD